MKDIHNILFSENGKILTTTWMIFLSLESLVYITNSSSGAGHSHQKAFMKIPLCELVSLSSAFSLVSDSQPDYIIFGRRKGQRIYTMGRRVSSGFILGDH